jgi:hypothetical protein
MDSTDTAMLALRFDNRRKGVSRPDMQVAAEMQNITDVLLELLKELRKKR